MCPDKLLIPSAGPMKASCPQTRCRPAKISRRLARIVGARPGSGTVTVLRDIRKLPLAPRPVGVSRSAPASYASVKAMVQSRQVRDWVAISPTCLDVGLGR